MNFSEKYLTCIFLSAIVDVEEVKTNLKVGSAEHILSHIEDTILCKLMKLVFLTTNLIMYFISRKKQ